MEDSSLMKVFNGEVLVDLIDGADNADKNPLTIFEKEVLRIFNEHTKLQAQLSDLRGENEKLKEVGQQVLDSYSDYVTDVMTNPITLEHSIRMLEHILKAVSKPSKRETK